MQRIANNTFLLFFNEIKLLQFHSSALFLCTVGIEWKHHHYKIPKR
ncbi:hypothetical protein M107_4954 [Bacteroides fragilis str. 3725 D9(v)]|nr:hypothetical protein M107_4954 [Bacteroides fragilis str. 3725 D9(v)]